MNFKDLINPCHSWIMELGRATGFHFQLYVFLMKSSYQYQYQMTYYYYHCRCCCYHCYHCGNENGRMPPKVMKRDQMPRLGNNLAL